MSLALDAPAPSGTAKRNVALLATMMALMGAMMPVYIVLGGLAGAMLAPDPRWATLPIAAQMVTAMLTAAPVSLAMGRFGRKPLFVLGGIAALGAGALGAYGIVQGSFTMLCGAHALGGFYQTVQNYFRFAATDRADDAFKPKAVSYVLAGGLVSALIGPELVIRFGDWFAPHAFAGAYAATLATTVLGMLAIPFLDLPRPEPGAAKAGRPMREIMRDRAVPVAMACAMASYGTMTFVMTASPLAIVACSYGTGDAADVVRWHVIAMFGPSFFTGHLIAWWGHARVIGAGLAMLAGCAAVALAGIELANFYAALVLLGLGWNFGFIGATALLATRHRPEERARVQGLNDLAVMSVVAVASLSSGAITASAGWAAVNLSALVPVGLAALALAWLATRGRGAAA